MDSKLYTFFFSLTLLQLTLPTESRAIAERSIEQFRRSVNGISSITKREEQPVPDFVINNYALTVFDLTPEWKKTDCNGVFFNCESVAKQHCDVDLTRFLQPDSHAEDLGNLGCKLSFTVDIEEGSSLKGVDLAIFMNPTERVKYYTYVFQLGQLSYLLSSRIIDSSCGSWQTFHLNNTALTGRLQPGTNTTVEILLAVITADNTAADGFSVSSCADIRKTFYLDSRSAENFNFTPHSEHKRDTGDKPREEESAKESEQPTEMSALPTISTALPSTEKPEDLYDGTTKETIISTTSSPTSTEPEIKVTQPPVNIIIPTHQKFLPSLVLFIDGQEALPRLPNW